MREARLFAAVLVAALAWAATAGTGRAADQPVRTSMLTPEERSVVTSKGNLQGVTSCPPEERIRESSFRIEVFKRARQLLLFSGGRLVRAYEIKLGRDPEGPKIRQGDNRTPEGTYYICSKNPQSRYHLSLGLSYPSVEDARRGLAQGLIGQREFRQIAERVRKRAIPPWNTPLGGEIFIHGDAEKYDWTFGCIALFNRDIEELFRAVPVGTPVIIRK